MKKIILSALVLFSLTSIENNTHAQVAYSSKNFEPSGVFESDKPAASRRTNEKNKSGSTVHLFNNDIETRVFYNSRGSQVGIIRYYGEDKLPNEVRHLVRSTYYDFNIFLVIEVTVNNKKVHLVKIEDKTCTKTIRVIDGEMEVIEEIEKTAG